MISINIHSIKAVRARLSNNRGTTWVDLKFFNEHGKSEEICVFFEDAEFANRLTTAINDLNKPSLVGECDDPECDRHA